MNTQHHLEEMSANYGNALEALGQELKSDASRHDGLSILQKLDTLSPIIKNGLVKFLSK